MKLRESFKKYVVIFLIFALLISLVLYINSNVSNTENIEDAENIKNVEDEDKIETIGSRDLTDGEVLITYSNNEYKITINDKTYPLYTSSTLYPNYRASDEKIESTVIFSNIVEYDDSLVVETLQNIETEDLHNYLYFYNGELIVQDYLSKKKDYDTQYYDNMCSINGALNGLQIFDLTTGEIVHRTYTHQGNTVAVGKEYICFDDDTFINLNSENKELERAWAYLENQMNDEQKLKEYKSLATENPWVFAFEECNENGDLVYNVNDYVDGVIQPVYTIYIPLE